LKLVDYEAAARFWHQEGDNFLAPFAIYGTDYSRLAHPRESQQNLLAFPRGDVLAAADDEIFLSVSQKKKPVCVEVTHVTRMQPTASKSLRGCLRFIEVAGHHIRPPDGDLTHLAQRQRLIFRVDYRHEL